MLTNKRMKAKKVLERYAAGERDFQRLNLRGQSFKGKNLSGADFSEADIRGANFTNAILKEAKFKGAKAGLQRRWAVGLVISAWLIAGISGFYSAIIGYFVGLIFHPDNSENFFYGVGSVIIILLIFLIVTTRNGMIAGFGAGAVAVAVAGAGAGAVAGAVAGAGAVAVAGAVAGAVAVAVAFAVASALPFAGAGVVAFASAVAFAVLLFSVYIGWRALAGDKRDAWIRSVAIAFAATGGTSFHNADLTDADFTAATLKSTDFRNATLTRTCWHQTKKLDRVRPGKSYLEKAEVRQLLITGQAQGKNYDRLDLRGVNLQAANLADTSFRGADLSQANLQDADLSRAKLVQTQLNETDLTGATLTGATIEDWGITTHTNLNGVRCEYVFMRETTPEDLNPRRKPDNWDEKFSDGDFADFIKPIVDTLDLYHNQGVDPRAIAISFKALTENNPEAELEIVAMEKRGKDKFLIKAKTAPEANLSALSHEYFETYSQVKSLPDKELHQLLLSAKDNHIQSLENTIDSLMNAFSRPAIYAQTYHNQGDTMSEKAETSNYDLRAAKFGGGFAGTGGTQTDGTLNDYSSNPNLTQAATEIQQLLQQLETTNPTTTNSEKAQVITKALEEIENNPALKSRVIAVLNSTNPEAFQVAINHPLAKKLVQMIEE